MRRVVRHLAVNTERRRLLYRCTMTTDPIRPDEVGDHLSKYRTRFILAPRMWHSCDLPFELRWHAVEFGEDNQDRIPTNRFGVYAFVLVPNFPGPPKSAYLLYIGKTERSFHARYGEYLRDETDDFAARPIERALQRWHGHIWFHYAAIGDPDSVNDTEETLINACIPPCNVKFTGTLGKAIHAFVGSPWG